MPLCRYCGDEIEFRHVGGVVKPIHINGGWCSGYKSSSNPADSSLNRSYKTYDSYLDPNARCPVCRAPVFFYQSPHGGRVFFDDVGWPWPKHQCTDNWNGHNREIGRPPFHLKTAFRSAAEKTLIVVSLGDIAVDDAEKMRILCKNTRRLRTEALYIGIEIKKADMQVIGIDLKDLQEAPALIIPKDDDGETEVSFICVRLNRIVALPTRIVLRK
jgi:hypothetical protein